MGLLASASYDHVGAEHLNPNPLLRPRAAKQNSQPENQLVIYPNGKKEFHLSLPYGVRPLIGSYEKFSVREKSPGEFVAIQSELQEQLSIPLVSVGALRMDRRNLPGYTQSSGIEAGKWPKAVKEFVKQLKRTGSVDPLRLGFEVTEFVKRNFRYYSESASVSKELLRATDALLKRLKTAGLPRPVALAHGGIVNCDGAAWIAALILRDFFQVPTRVVAGTTASETEKEDETLWTLARTGVPRHMWIEVWAGEHWEPFDPTPPYSPPGEGSGEQSASSDSGEKAEATEEKEADTGEEGKESKEEEGSESKDDTQTQGEGHDTSPSNPTPLRILDQAGFNTPEEKLLAVLAETIETHGIEAALRTGKKTEALVGANRLLGLLHPEGAAATATASARLLQLAAAQKHFPQLSPTNLLGNIRVSLSQGEYRKAYAELRSLLPLFEALKARRELNLGEQTYLDQLHLILEEFMKMNHADAAEFDLAERVLSHLSGPLARRWVQETYGEVLRLGSPALRKFVDDLKAGTLASLSRVALLESFGPMVAQITPEPETGTVRVWERDPIPRGNNQDLVIARSPLELPRMLLMPRPGEPLFAPLFEGRQFSLGTQREVPSREPTRVLERKLLVVFLDVSGSMQINSRITVLNDLIVVLLDYAMRETDRQGRPLTQVILVPFESTLADGNPIETLEGGYNIASQVLSHAPPFTAGGGTDIEGALVSFYEAVKASYNKVQTDSPKRDLKRATAVFLTDGGSTVNPETISKAQEGLPSDVDIFVNFIAIGESNAELEEICKQSNLGTTKPMVRSILDPQIQQLLAAANQWKADAEAFATSHTLLPPPGLLRELSALTHEPLNAVNFESDSGIAVARRRILGTQTGQGADRSIPPLVSTLIARWRRDSSLDPALRKKLVAALFTVYREWRGWEDAQVTREEKKFFVELLRWSGEEG